MWAARFFKSRALAAGACELGKIQSNQQPAKPAGGVIERASRRGDVSPIERARA
jgi:ribosomal 50S subunit-recycling heat shock protein